jgi:hypothetical protein
MATMVADQRMAQKVARELMSGTMPERVIEGLVQKGWEKGEAQEFVFGVRHAIPVGDVQAQQASARPGIDVHSRHMKNMLLGLVWCVGGSVVTLYTYQQAMANPMGGQYLVAWGAVVFGFFQFLSGLTGVITNRDQ